jgi:LmbE family N-acetylglucosaminyl deacetylase
MGPLDLGTILGVWAHPDDEAFLSAGVMAAATTAGQRVVVATATLGEDGTPNPERWPPERMAAVRRWELRASLAVVGVSEHHLLGYRDGTLATVALEEGIGRVAELIARVRPDTLLTFGPDGMTGHPDHRAVSQWTTLAWERAGRPGRLLYATTPVGFAAAVADIDSRFNIYFAGPPPETPDEEMALRFPLPGPLLDRKLVALRAQASQTAPLVAELGVERLAEWVAEECFRAAGQSGEGTIRSQR